MPSNDAPPPKFPRLPLSVTERTVPQLLERAASDAPERTALIAHSLLSGGEVTATYDELARDSGRLAGALAERGVEPGDRVAIMIANDGAYEAHLAYHASHRLGAINVPVNTFYVERELEYVIALVRPKAIVFASSYGTMVNNAAASATAPALIEAGSAPNVGEPLADLLAPGRSVPAPAPIEETSDADWIFTSGTTGHPKAVAISHAAAVACGHEAIHVWGLSPRSVYQNSSPFFTSTGCHTNLLACLAAQCTFVIDPEVDAQAIFDRAVRHGTTSMFVLTAILAILFRRLDEGRLASFDVPTLKRLLYGGQTMPRAFHERLEREFAALRGVELGVVYGLSEGGTSGVMLDPTDHADAVRRHGPYGLSIGRRPWNDWIEHRIVGDGGNDIDVGDVGEIWLRAPSIMSRYVGDEAATAKALAGGWLHTGDMATVDDHGFIYFVDRSSSMIRRGGLNIAAAEVEAVALGHPAVAEVAAIGRPNPVLGEDVHLIAVALPGVELDAAELLAFCRERLAEYKVPRSVSFLDALPRNAMGKVSRSELRGASEQSWGDA